MGRHDPTIRNHYIASVFDLAVDRIRTFALSEKAAPSASLAFGDVSTEEFRAAVTALEKSPPKVEIVSAATLQGGHAAYSAEANTIFVSADFIADHQNNQEAIVAVLIEEIGHALDNALNAQDSAGDEGAIFARLVSGGALSDLELQALKADADNRLITVDGRVLSVEYAGTYGSITVNGNLSDWVPADRLDSGASSVANYEVYGKVVGGSFVIALKSNIAIGAGTTFWFDTDLNKATGYQIWGFAGGAEFNVNLTNAGVPVLYRGNAGQTVVTGVTLDYTFSADRKVLEFAIPVSVLGNAQSADMLIDVNNSVYLSPDYANLQYRVDADPVTTVVGGVTIDGSLADWTSAQRIDGSAPVANYEVYGRDVGDSFIIAIKSAQAIGLNTTAWLNTDLNVATGYQIWGFAGGAEYNINFNGQSKPALYSGAAGQTLVNGSLVYGLSADKTIVELVVPKSMIGSPAALGLLFDINDSVFLPGSYASAQYVISTAPVTPPTAPVVGATTLDGSLADWAAGQRIDTLGASPGYEVYGKIDGDHYIIAIKSAVAIGFNTTAWLNTDLNATTGFQVFNASSGAEYNINFDASGKPGLYTGNAGQTLVNGAVVQYGYSADRTVVEFAVARSAINAPNGVGVMLDVNNTVFLPDHYPAGQFRIMPTLTTPAVVGDTTIDGALGEWNLSQRIDGVDGAPGYEVYGRVVGDSFVFAVKSDVVIGAGTTAWLNTDRNAATGQTAFGGAEFNVNIGADGVPQLFTGTAGKVLVANGLPYAYSADNKTIEFAVARSLIGSPTSLNVVFDINDAVNLPGDPLTKFYTVTPPPVVGDLTVDGALTDWTAANRIDAVGGQAGYEVYGKFTGGSYAFAIKSAEVIGANTTIWLNTDLNAATGYQIFGFSGGAEYKIEIDATGKPTLMNAVTNTAIEGAVVQYGYSADKRTIELTVLQSALGNAPSAHVVMDINDTTFLPGSYTTPFFVTAPPPPPPVVGDVTLDGALTDWTAAQRIDSFGGVADHEVYGKITGGSFAFAIKAPTAIGAGTTIWLNTDLNAATGYQIFGNLGGAEYKIEFDATGKPVLFNAVTNVAVEGAVVQYGYSADKRTVELTITQAAVGNAPSLLALIDVNDLTFLPGSYAGAQYVVAPPPPPPATVGDVLLDGALTDWTAAQRIDAFGGAAGHEVYGKVTGGAFAFAIKAVNPIGDKTTIWLNTDLNAATGYQIFGNLGGAEYRIEIDPTGKPTLYNAVTGVAVDGAVVQYGYSADKRTLELAVSQASVGNAPSLLALLDVNDAVFLPGEYAGAQYVVAPPPPPPTAVGDLMLDGALTDWNAAYRIDGVGGVADHEVYGKIIGGSLALAIKAVAPIGPNTTVWLNTDLNATTGYQIFGWAGGAEYRIEFDATGKPVLFNAVTNVAVAGATVQYSYSADKRIVELAISQALIGNPTNVHALIDLNDSVNLPTNYGVPFLVSPPPPPPAVVGDLTLDGALTDWTAAHRIDAFGGNVDHEVYGKITGGSFAFAIKAPTAIGANTTVWLNTDLNAATGYQIFGNSGGAEYKIEFDATGKPVLFNAVTNTAIEGAVVQYGYSADKRTVEFTVTQASLGNVPSVQVLIDVNDQTFLPGTYAGAQYVVAPPQGATPVGSFIVDGLLTDWTAAGRIDKGAVPAGTELYGQASGEYFVVAIKAPTAFTGGTTLWLNTDRNDATGFHPFGGANTGGAEFNIDFDASGRPRLFTGDAGQSLVTGGDNLIYAYSTDKTVVEIAIPKALINSPLELSMIMDLNNTVFLPEGYVGAQYEIFDGAQLAPRVDQHKRVAIVYSETTANAYFDKTAYNQLFMNAQNQAAMAGVPFDILTENDLKNINTLKEYDSIIFPSFRNVKTADYTEIANTLELAVKHYKIGMITAGDFMSNNETGAAILPEPYKVMRDLFDLWRADGGQAVLDVTAVNNTHAIMQGYTVGELIRHYDGLTTTSPSESPGGPPIVTQSGVPWSSYVDPTPANGAHTVLARQTVNGNSTDAVVAIENYGRTVHFSDQSLMADSNQLQHAIEWSVGGSGITAGLQMSRMSSIFAARNDMDQAQQVYDVSPEGGGPGIYNRLLPILQDWKAQFNFVGSYYIDIGNYGPDEQTNWAVSKPLFDAMLAMGNEIGSHSYTHPHDTNLLFPNVITQEMLTQRVTAYQALLNTTQVVYTPYATREDADPAVLQQLAALTLTEINQRIAAALASPNPSTLGLVDKALLESTYQFQFQASRAAIEANLGIISSGAAVPGAPEKMAASLAMLQYYDYLTGGYSAVGAGYPGAFGYISPDLQDKIYLAPNMSFDFTLVEFQKHSPAEALAIWQTEFANLLKHADVPVVLWPWHDYGPTGWSLDAGNASPYNREMFQNFLATAYASGAEFVTVLDLANRIKAFEKSTINYTVSGNTVTATVGSVDAGKFALDLDGLGTQKIASVAGWYAYDDDSIFLPKAGGTFVATVGANATDVTRIIELPMRAELVSLSGDGRNLTFTVVGEGRLKIDIQNPGNATPVVTGATVVSLVGEILTLDIGANGSHTVSVTMGAAATNAPIITSNGGGTTAAIAILENATAVTTVTATDADAGQTIAYSIAGGADAARFSINPTTGALVFVTAPDFEAPTDAGANNVYDVIVRATDSTGLFDDQAIAVTVGNVVGPTINGTSAANIINGTNEEETINGLGGNDTINGLGGNDTINGGDGADTIDGGAGNDTLNGDAGNDIIRGGTGNDIINGGAGNDTLYGDDGDDRINGGAGIDVMTGGAGADTFIFNVAISEIGNGTTRTTRDSITDFQPGVDKIDLSAIDANTGVTGNQAFTFLSTPGAAITAAGQIHFLYTTIGGVALTVIEGNVNAALAPDFRIELVGTHNLTANDFIL